MKRIQLLIGLIALTLCGCVVNKTQPEPSTVVQPVPTETSTTVVYP